MKSSYAKTASLELACVYRSLFQTHNSWFRLTKTNPIPEQMFRNQHTRMLRHNVCAQAEKRFSKKKIF
jgi:hypothetical protein